MNLRRPHQKSRHGCLQCKRRRVKVRFLVRLCHTNQQCDETRPTCSNCSNRQAACEYESSGTLLWRNEAGPQRHTQPDLTNPLLQGQSSDTETPTLNMADLELMLQWCNSTHKALSRNPRLDPIWRYLVTEEALSQPFLMHGILAVSALHLSRSKPGPYIDIAVAHQNRALALFRELLGDINPTNAKAMFAFASIVVVYSFGSPQTLGEREPRSVVDDLYQALALCKGVQQVIHTASSSLWDGSFMPLLQVDGYTPYLPDGAQQAMDRLRETNCACRNPAHDTFAYGQVIDKLAEELGAVHGGVDSITAACRWAIRLNPKYMDDLREHRPLALVILVYYCVLLHYLKQNWCLDGWGKRVAGAIWALLDDEWRPLAHWAMVEIFGSQLPQISTS